VCFKPRPRGAREFFFFFRAVSSVPVKDGISELPALLQYFSLRILLRAAVRPPVGCPPTDTPATGTAKLGNCRTLREMFGTT